MHSSGPTPCTYMHHLQVVWKAITLGLDKTEQDFKGQYGGLTCQTWQYRFYTGTSPKTPLSAITINIKEQDFLPLD